MANRIALVTHTVGGGVWSVVRFLENVLRRTQQFKPDIIVLATSARDAASVRLFVPRSWRSGVQVTIVEADPQAYRHVGAFLTEFEFQRYAPRRVLNELLQPYDLIQVVGGTPAWARAVCQLDKPICLFAATVAKQERTTLLQRTHSLKRYWLQLMTHFTSHIEIDTLPRMTTVFAESEYTRHLLARYVDSSKLYLGPPGIDTTYFSPSSHHGSNQYILTVGRLSDPRKNVRVLLEAYALVRRARPMAPQLVLAGRTGLTPEDIAYASRLGIQDAITVLTELSLEQLRSMYQGAMLFVLSSDEEGLGVVILEAMASGLAVVSTDCGGPATAVKHGETGFLTPVGNAQKLANAMLALLENPAMCRKMGEAARSQAESLFSLEAAGRVYLDQYDKILKSRLR